MALARAVRLAASLVFAVIVLGIVLWLASANSHNAIVADVHDVAKWLVGPFQNVFSVKGAKLDLGLNWGLAAIIYLAAGHLIATAMSRASFGRPVGRGRVVT